eukprot:9222065-Alexandrium_andersonii.AAC.1
MTDWFKVVPPIWSIMTNPQVTSLVSGKVERTVKLMENLMLEVSSMGERNAGRSADSVPTELFRIAGLFEEFGCA